MSIITDICSMYILLAAATTLEIQSTTRFLEQAGLRLGDHTATLLTTGVGAFATTHALMRQTRLRRPDLVLQAGIAGCFGSRQAGDLVVIKEEILDLGAWEDGRFQSLFDLRLAGPDTPPFSGGALVNPHKKLLDLSGLERVRSLSVGEITTEPDRIAWYEQHLAPVVESMEGGALHYTCLQENIPFLQIRSVSNAVGVRDKTKWDIPLAVGRLNEALIGFLNRVAGLGEGILDF